MSGYYEGSLGWRICDWMAEHITPWLVIAAALLTVGTVIALLAYIIFSRLT